MMYCEDDRPRKIPEEYLQMSQEELEAEKKRLLRKLEEERAKNPLPKSNKREYGEKVYGIKW